MTLQYREFTLTVLFCTFSAFLSAQAIHKPGQYKIDHHIYVVSQLSYGGRLLIKENSSLIARVGKTPGSLSKIEFTKISSKETIQSTFVEVLGMKRIKELIPEKHILVKLFFDTNGKVQAVEYFLNKNSALTLKEINELTTSMKQNITFKVPSFIEKNNKMAIFSQLIRFNKLVN